jgi:hypothetical protein
MTVNSNRWVSPEAQRFFYRVPVRFVQAIAFDAIFFPRYKIHTDFVIHCYSIEYDLSERVYPCGTKFANTICG